MFDEILNKRFTCLCGRIHQIKGIKEIVMEEGAIYKLSNLIKNNYANALFVYDENTYIYSNKVEEVAHGYHYSFVFECPGGSRLVPDEKAVGQLLIAAANAGLIVAVGSGAINDLCRYISFRTHVPYFSIPTSPSMDGFASPVSPLISNSLKTTHNCVLPTAIIADLDLIKTAPTQMFAAGIGDLIGKNTCLCDWRLASIVENEYFCSKVEDMVRTAMLKCIGNLESIQRGEPKGMAVLMEGLLLSGLAMSYTGNSRPSAGSEHHISHFWEMMFLLEGRTSTLHGLKIGLATLVVIRLYELLREATIDWEAALERASRLRFSDYEAKIRKIYKKTAEAIIQTELETRYNSAERTIIRINKYKENWIRIIDAIEVNIPEYSFVYDILHYSGGVVKPEELEIGRELFKNSILYAKEIRRRHTILQLLSDLGLLEAYAERLADEFFEVDKLDELSS